MLQSLSTPTGQWLHCCLLLALLVTLLACSYKLLHYGILVKPGTGNEEIGNENGKRRYTERLRLHPLLLLESDSIM